MYQISGSEFKSKTLIAPFSMVRWWMSLYLSAYSGLFNLSPESLRHFNLKKKQKIIKITKVNRNFWFLTVIGNSFPWKLLLSSWLRSSLMSRTASTCLKATSNRSISENPMAYIMKINIKDGRNLIFNKISLLEYYYRWTAVVS